MRMFRNTHNIRILVRYVIYQHFETIRFNKNIRNKTYGARRFLYRIFFAEFLLNRPATNNHYHVGHRPIFRLKTRTKQFKVQCTCCAVATYLCHIHTHIHTALLDKRGVQRVYKLISVVRFITILLYYIIIISNFLALFLPPHH